MAELKLVLNGKTVLEEIAPDMLLLDFVRSQGCYSVKKRMRDCKLWSLHCFGGWNTNAVLFNACDACEWKNGDDDGRHAGGSGRVWGISCK